MPLDAEKLLALKIPAVEQSYGPKDCMLYALGLGLGQATIVRRIRQWGGSERGDR